MGAFTGRSKATLRSRLPVEETVAAWLDLDRQGRCQPEPERLETRGDTLFVALPEEQHGPARFKSEYRLRWTRQGDTVRCETVEGNTKVTGTARFRPAPGGGCTVEYEETVEIDLGLNRLVSKAIKPIAERLMSHGQADYSRRMQAELDQLS